MEKLIIILTLVLSFNASALTVISDLDDTLKITNVASKPRAVWNALFNKNAFKGMPELMEKFDKAGSDLYIVSASPNMLRSRIDKFIAHNEIAYKEIYTRNLSQLGQKEAYKLAAIREIINSTSDEYILIGDDTEIDALVYEKIQKEFPTKIKAVYIHQVQGNKSISGIKYHTAFDIMVSEYKAGRMSSIAVLDMAKDFMFLKDLSLVFPKFKYCPTQISSFNTDLPFIVREASKGVYNRIIKYCNERF